MLNSVMKSIMNKADVLKFVRHVYRKERGLPDRRLIHPRREWLLGVAAFMVITCAGALWSINTFNGYTSLNERTFAAPQELPSYNEALIEAAITEFSKREEDYSRLIEQLPEKTPESVPNGEEDISTSTEEITNELGQLESQSSTSSELESETNEEAVELNEEE